MSCNIIRYMINNQAEIEHRHRHDRGIGAFFGYFSLLPYLWRSEVAREVVNSTALRAGERVVDLGAGMGSATSVAVCSGASVIAIDPAPYMRFVLRFRGLLRRWSVTVMDGAAESIPLEDSSIDALWTINTIHHWTNKAAACREIARVMRPHGRVLLVDEDFRDPAHPEHMRHFAAGVRFHFDEVDPEELSKLLRKSGFASAEGVKASIAGRPAKVVRATR